MADLADGESAEVKGSAAKPYVLTNTGGVYSCTCPAWQFQSTPVELRTCKHLRTLRGAAAEEERVGAAGASPRRAPRAADGGGEAAEKPPLLLAHSWDNAAEVQGW